MRRELAVALALWGCHKDTAESKDPPAPVPMPTPPPEAQPKLVELLHRDGAMVVVSSQVQNDKILPSHLVDGNLESAWNSRTGELVGAWIEVTVPGTIGELRLTAGHTGHGPKHEDYFTMNPRIRRIQIVQKGKVLGTFPLDPEKRDLQTVKVPVSGTFRIRIADILPGSKKRWRETCISELEVWGQLPAGAAPKVAPPAVKVASPPLVFDEMCATLEADKADYHARAEAFLKECQERNQDMNTCGIDEAGEPECSVKPFDIARLRPPWKRGAVLTESTAPNYDQYSFTIVVDSTEGAAVARTENVEGRDKELEVLDATVRDVLPGGPPELVIRTRLTGDAASERLTVCRADPIVACSKPVPKTVTVGPTTLEFP